MIVLKDSKLGVGAGTHASQRQVPKLQARRVDPKTKKEKNECSSSKKKRNPKISSRHARRTVGMESASPSASGLVDLHSVELHEYPHEGSTRQWTMCPREERD
jgi:hypothetical protein